MGIIRSTTTREKTSVMLGRTPIKFAGYSISVKRGNYKKKASPSSLAMMRFEMTGTGWSRVSEGR
jgi:hypothetical protein